MKRWIWIPVITILAGIAVTVRAFSIGITHRPDVPSTPAMVERGAYLVKAADCISCHTTANGQPFAGGREFDLGNMGKLYSPNITPDKETGIGTWSDDDFRAALQLGIGKGGVRLYPAFPFAAFTKLSDDDALAIKAYLFSLKPVHSTPPANAMNFPYDQRWLMAYWSWLFDSNERFKPDSTQSPEWNQGKYLVTALGHCGECHTERNFLQATSGSKALGGAVTQKWKAYDITPAKSGIGGWTDDELVSYLSTGFAKDHGPAAGPMAEAISNSLSQLPASDIRSIVAYLRSAQPVASTVEVAAVDGPAAAAKDANLAYGRAVFARSCANCHKLDGSGTQSQYEALKGSETVSDPQAINLTQVVLDGSNLQLPNGHVQMLGFGRGLTDTDVAAVVNYVTQQLGGHSANLTPKDIAERR